MRIENYLTIEQKIGKLYIFSASPDYLIENCKAALREISENAKIGEQRILDKRRVKNISSYIEKNPFATFPTPIVLSTTSDNVKFEKEALLINTTQKLSILDGQHRLGGFKKVNPKSYFNVPVTLFVFDDKNMKTEVFKTINSNQTPVNTSLRNELEQDTILETPEKFIVSLAKILNYDEKSVLQNKIEFYNEKSKKPISYAAFHRETIRLLYNDNDYNSIRHFLFYEKTFELAMAEYIAISKNLDKYSLFEFYRDSKIKTLYKEFNDFFTAIKTIFNEDWHNKNSFVLKSIMFRVFMLILDEIIMHNQLEGFDYYSYLEPLKIYNGKLNKEYYSASSYGDATKMFNMFSEKIKNK